MERGIYINDGFVFEPKDICLYYWGFEEWKKAIDWFSSIDLNLLEFTTQIEFLRFPSTELEEKKIELMKNVIDYAHKKNMQVSYIVTTNVVSIVPKDEEPKGYIGDRFVQLCPQSKDYFLKTIDINKYFIEQYKDADIFEIFAGDWGGCQCGECNWETYLEYCKEYYGIIKGINKKASIYLNTWAIAYWSKPINKKSIHDGEIKRDPYWKEIFDNEISFSEKIIERMATLPYDFNITVPFHHFYRPLCLVQYDEKNYPNWPNKKVVDKIHKMGRKIFAWPYFIVEDDPFRPDTFGKIHSEVMYLSNLIKKLFELNLDGIIGNICSSLSVINIYAYAKLILNPKLRRKDIFEGFADLVVEKQNSRNLTYLLEILDDCSSWYKQMPKEKRLLLISQYESFLKSTNELKEIKNTGKEGHLMLSSRDFLNYLDNSF
jgi:hypothetical protein